MITAIRKVHAPKGPWVTEGGYEYNAAAAAGSAWLTAERPEAEQAQDEVRAPRQQRFAREESPVPSSG